MFIHPYGALVIFQLDFQDIHDLPLRLFRVDRKGHLDTAVQVAFHPVGRSKIYFFFSFMKEVPHPRMFQIGIYNAGYRDIFAERLVGYKAADSPDDQINLHSRLAGPVKCIDHPFVFQAVHF